MSKPTRDSAPGGAVHRPVLLREVIQILDLKPGLTVVDGTVGAAGHARKILDRLGETGFLLGLDRDPMMLQHAETRLKQNNCRLRHASYIELPRILEEEKLKTVDRVLLDLGLSSDQLADDSRGFGFDAEGPLDFRFDTTSGQPAWEWIAEHSEAEITHVLETFGEERFSKAIAQELMSRRKTQPVKSTADFIEAVLKAVPDSAKRSARKHPATRVFQALRIAVNRELEHVETALRSDFAWGLETLGLGRRDYVSFAGRSNSQGRISGPKPMAKPHTASNPRLPHGTADQPPLATGQTAGSAETPAATAGDGRIASLSSQLKGLAADVGKSAPSEPAPKPEAKPAAPTGTTGEGGEDWGIAPPKSGMSRETKMGFAFVFVLLVVFGFVAYKKVERSRAERGELLAAAQESTPQQKSPESQTAADETAQHPIAENTPPPAQKGDPLAESPQPTPAASDAWSGESFEPPPQPPLPQPTEVAASPPINAFPPESGQAVSPPTEPQTAQAFPMEQEFQPPAATTQTPAAGPPVAFNPVPQNEFAEASTPPPTPPGFTPPTEFVASNELPEQKPAAAAPNNGEPATEQPNPFETGSVPMQPEPAPAAPMQPEPAPAAPTQAEFVPSPAEELENEQFSAQSQPAPRESESTPPMGNPFGETAETQSEKSVPAEIPPAQPASVVSGGDPFGVNPAIEQAPKAAEPVAAPPAETSPGFEVAQAPEAVEFNPIGQSPPKVVETAPPQPLPIPERAPVETPMKNDPRFGDFQPAPLPSQAAAGSSRVPNELPREMIAQLSATQTIPTGATGTGQMQPGDRPEVYVVRSGDNYWTISKQQYGTARYFAALARYNQQRIPDPKKMRPGMKVLTPARELLESRNPDLFPKFTANAAGVPNAGQQPAAASGFYLDAKGGPMYRVGPKDTLGGIAQKHLGRFSRWTEIYQLNRNRLKNPNALTLGDVLQLPPDASRVSIVPPATGVR